MGFPGGAVVKNPPANAEDARDTGSTPGPGHPTCLLRNLYAGQEAQLQLDMEKQTGSTLGKEYIKVVY